MFGAASWCSSLSLIALSSLHEIWSSHGMRFFFLWRFDSIPGYGLPLLDFAITLRHTTLDRTPLDEWSARRRDLCLTKHHNQQETDINASGGIRNNERAVADPHCRPLGHANFKITIFDMRSSFSGGPLSCVESRVSSVGVVSEPVVGRPGARHVLSRVHSHRGAHQDCCLMGAREVKWPGHEADPWPHLVPRLIRGAFLHFRVLHAVHKKSFSF